MKDTLKIHLRYTRPLRMENLTIVITTCRRPDRLKACLRSLPPGMPVVVSGIYDEDSIKAVSRYKVTETWMDKDWGVNELWLRGVYAAKTKHVLILHDDDKLSPRFSSEYKSFLAPSLAAGSGFAVWGALEVNEDPQIADKAHHVLGDSTSGIYSSYSVFKKVYKLGAGPVSPTLCIYNRELCIQTLKEVSHRWTGEAMCSKDRWTMLYGNDVLLCLRHCERFSTVAYSDKKLTLFGNWSGSESGSMEWGGDSCNHFIQALDNTREYFRQNRSLSTKSTPRAIRVVSRYYSTDPEENRRENFAESTWEPDIQQGSVIPVDVWENARSGRDIHPESRDVPFIKDLLEEGVRSANPEDLVILTNNDTCIITTGVDRILDRFAHHPSLQAGFAFRRTFPGIVDIHMKHCTHGRLDCGVDLIAFRPSWWTKISDQMPDMVYGYEWWDLVIRNLILEESTLAESDLGELIYHEDHEGHWKSRDKATWTMNRFNMRKATNFQLVRGRRNAAGDFYVYKPDYRTQKDQVFSTACKEC